MKKNNIISIVAGILLVFAAVSYGLFAGPARSEKADVVIFGDSLIGNDRTETSVTARLSKLTNLKVYNAGIGGTTMSAGFDLKDRWSDYSMVRISRSFAEKDFSVMLSDIPKEYFDYSSVLDYANDTILRIAHIDASKVRYVIIEQGVNDYLGGVPLDNPLDRSDESTFCGALRETASNIKKAMPGATVVIVSPCFSWTQGGPSDAMDTGYGTVEAYVEAERRICEEEDLLFVDLYHDSGINRHNYEQYLYDSLHLNDEGSAVMAELIYEKIKDR